MRTFTEAIPLGVLLVGAFGCSSSDSMDAMGDGSASGGGTSSAFMDLCSKVTFQDFSTACGVSATSAVSTDHASTGPDDPASVSGCEYDEGSAERLCFRDGPAAAKLFYDNERKPEGSATTDEDLTGVGDEAFYRETLAINEAFVYVLKGELLIDVQIGNVTTAGGAKACLIDVANQVLAAQ